MSFTIYEAPQSAKRRIPAWTRRAIIDENGAVFVPPAVAGVSEMAAMLCAGWDGQSGICNSGHIYLPAEWMKSEYPDCVELVDKIIRRVRE